MSQPLKVFISYARKDAAFKDDLLTHLRPLIRNRVIEIWHDDDIETGDEWAEEITSKLMSADIILFLVSPAFMASDYIHREEIKRAEMRYQRKEMIIVPIWIKPVADTDLFLDKFQSLPKDRKPVSQWQDQDEAWVDVVTRLKKLFERKNNPTPSSDVNNDTIPPTHIITGNNNVIYQGVNNNTIPSTPTSNTAPTSPPQQIRNLVSKGKTKEAIENLIEYTAKSDSDKNQEALLLSSRWNGVERQERLGLMSYGEIQMERNRINASLLALLEDL